MKKWLIGLMALTISISGVAQKKIFYINSEQKDCTGVGPMKCLQYKENPADGWKLMYQGINGFNYEPGYLYKIKVKQAKVPNPPADGSSIAYKLLKIISKNKDTAMENRLINAPHGKYILASLWMDGKLTNVSAKAYEMEFKKDENQVYTKICNNISGQYTLDGNKIKFGPMRSTRMMCPDMNFETAFNQALEQVDNISYDKAKLLLKKGNDVLITLIMPMH